MEIANDSERLRLLVGPATSNSVWIEVPVLEARWNPILARFGQLTQARLTRAMVAADFFRRRLAPFQSHIHPAWFYTGDDDASRLEFNPDDHMVAEWLELAMEEKDPAEAFLPEGVHPLCNDPAASRCSVSIR